MFTQNYEVSSVFWLFPWSCLSIVLVLYNKYILGILPYPITLSFMHMFFFSSVLGIYYNCFAYHEFKASYRSAQLAALTSASIIFRNYAYLYLSVALIQIMSSFLPVFIYLIMCTRSSELKIVMIAPLLTISAGIMLAVLPKLTVHYNWTGLGFQLAGTIFEAFRGLYLQDYMQSGGIGVSTALYTIAPLCTIIMLVPVCLLELPSLRLEKLLYMGNNGSKLVGNASLAFMLNAASLKCFKHNSSITISITSVIKDCALFYIANAIFGTVLPRSSHAGWCMACVGMLVFHILRYKESIRKKAPGAN